MEYPRITIRALDEFLRNNCCETVFSFLGFLHILVHSLVRAVLGFVSKWKAHETSVLRTKCAVGNRVEGTQFNSCSKRADEAHNDVIPTCW